VTARSERLTGRCDCGSGGEHLKTVAVRAYAGQERSSVQQKRIRKLLPMVPKIAQRVVSYLKPPLSFEDLVSAGTIGLIRAARDYDPSRKTDFKTYAYIRVKGAILDELRGWCFVPANLNKEVRRAGRVREEIRKRRGEVPTDEELAEALGISMERLYKIFESARARHFLSLDGCYGESPVLGCLLSAGASQPDNEVERAELIEKLTEAIEQLPRRQRRIILLYYQQNLTMKQAAEVFEITESRVSQLHASALFNLSVKLKEWRNER